VSVDILEDVSGVVIVAVSTEGVVTVVVVSVVEVLVALSLHAANTPIDNTNKSFFILRYFVVNSFVLIQEPLKGNPVTK